MFGLGLGCVYKDDGSDTSDNESDKTGSTKQRNLYKKSKNFQYVLKDLKEHFYN